MTDEFRPDWMAAELLGQKRTLEWYVREGLAGDQGAARRALQWVVDSLSPAALAQNGGALGPVVVEVLRDIAAEAAEGRDAPLVKAARVRPAHRGKDQEKAGRVWWACLEMHRIILAGCAQTDAAARVLQGRDWMEPGSLVKEYRRLRPALEAYESEGRPY